MSAVTGGFHRRSARLATRTRSMSAAWPRRTRRRNARASFPAIRAGFATSRSQAVQSAACAEMRASMGNTGAKIAEPGAVRQGPPWYSGGVAHRASVGEARRRLPGEFLEILEATFPQPVAEAILRGMGDRRCTTLRANTLRGSAGALMRFFRDNAVKYRRVPWYNDAFVLAELRERDAQAWPSYAEGQIYLQSLSSMVPALALGPQPGERVLDLAAAPGSKTTQLAALMGNSGSILANDSDALRLERLAYNVRMQGCSIVEVRLGR